MPFWGADLLCVCMDFCRMGLQLLGILERDERAFYASSSLFVSADYGKTPTIQPRARLIHWYRIQGRSKLGRNGDRKRGHCALMTFRRDSGIPVGGILEFADAEEIKWQRCFAPLPRNEETKQTSGLPRLFLRFCMEPRSLEQPPVLPAGGREAAGRSSS